MNAPVEMPVYVKILLLGLRRALQIIIECIEKACNLHVH